MNLLRDNFVKEYYDQKVNDLIDRIKDKLNPIFITTRPLDNGYLQLLCSRNDRVVIFTVYHNYVELDDEKFLFEDGESFHNMCYKLNQKLEEN